MEDDDLKTFEETIRRGRNRSVKAKLATDYDDDVEGVCLPFLPDAGVHVWMRCVLIKFY